MSVLSIQVAAAIYPALHQLLARPHFVDSDHPGVWHSGFFLEATLSGALPILAEVGIGAVLKGGRSPSASSKLSSHIYIRKSMLADVVRRRKGALHPLKIALLTILCIHSLPNLEVFTMNYHERLTPWIVQQATESPDQRILARFRRRAEAEAYLNAMRHRYPYNTLSVGFAAEAKA
ncbi:MAG: hypothetical protein VKK04_17285 [Synechococcales bacterium]|nr:hypothetical protein [Synechococcales bacterium]